MITITVFLFSISIFCQTKESSSFILPIKGDINETVEHLKQTLIDNGNYIESEISGVITTEMRNTKTKPKWTYQYHYRIRVKENKIYIIPFWTMNVSYSVGAVQASSGIEQWHYSDRKNINGFIFNETMEMLKEAGYNEVIFN